MSTRCLSARVHLTKGVGRALVLSQERHTHLCTVLRVCLEGHRSPLDQIHQLAAKITGDPDEPRRLDTMSSCYLGMFTRCARDQRIDQALDRFEEEGTKVERLPDRQRPSS
ncbi:MAG: hypothetical protein IIA72_00940 [Proteobacteria bacterium]|nr:hypothetical protein [Pseudomonadota bacterium]